jgi:hypothetical protein
MKKELDERLCAKYPKIFRDRHADMKVTCMCWGLDVGNGWYHIIDMLCATIQGEIESTISNRKWALKHNAELAAGKVSEYEWMNTPREVPDEPHQVVAVQVKEKFGTLRFYVNGASDATYAAIQMAENMSARTCDICGCPGETGGQGWISTRCDAHRDSNWRDEDFAEQEQKALKTLMLDDESLKILDERLALRNKAKQELDDEE